MKKKSAIPSKRSTKYHVPMILTGGGARVVNRYGKDKNGVPYESVQGLQKASPDGPHLISEAELRDLGAPLPEDIFPKMGNK